MERTKPLSGELLRIKEEIAGYARDFGLDFPDVIFEICDYETINILASQGGFPTRYPHWRFGMDYDQVSKNYSYGLQKIYEMVINTEPCYAYLLNVNPLVDQKIVMAHVYAHADFFKNNYWFKNTNRKMMDVMANHATKIRRYMDQYGTDKVEDFVDCVQSLDNLLDINFLYKNQGSKKLVSQEAEKDELYDDLQSHLKTFLRSKEKTYRKDDLGKDLSNDEDEISRESEYLPSRDILGFLMEFGPLKEWQADIIGILREEAYYFLPQRITKIMNEGWASYWHSKIMTQKALKASEIVDFADHHSAVTAVGPTTINPYKIGLELFRDIENRWNSGRFGKEYNECADMELKSHWDKNLMLGQEKIFQVRKSHNDITFLDQFFTEDFCRKQKLFTYKYNIRTGKNEIESRDFFKIKNKLLLSLTNFGSPMIEVSSSNFGNRGELLLNHLHQGIDLDIGFANDTLKNLYSLWRRPINLVTKFEEKEIRFHFDGQEIKTIQ